jgi:hypothetical protein
MACILTLMRRMIDVFRFVLRPTRQMKYDNTFIGYILTVHKEDEPSDANPLLFTVDDDLKRLFSVIVKISDENSVESQDMWVPADEY